MAPDLAGKLRGPDLPADVTFGEHHRGTPHQEVLGELTRLEEDLARRMAEFDDRVSLGPVDELVAEQLGGSLHAHIVRIHRFLDGNDRTSGKRGRRWRG